MCATKKGPGFDLEKSWSLRFSLSLSHAAYWTRPQPSLLAGSERRILGNSRAVSWQGCQTPLEHIVYQNWCIKKTCQQWKCRVDTMLQQVYKSYLCINNYRHWNTSFIFSIKLLCKNSALSWQPCTVRAEQFLLSTNKFCALLFVVAYSHARRHAAAPALALFLSLARSVSTSPGQREATEKILKSGRQSKADGNANEASKTKIHNRDGMQSEEEYNKVNKKAW